MEYVERFPRWSEVQKPPEQVRGDTMAGVVGVIARERDINRRKAKRVGWGFRLLLAGVIFVSTEAAILGLRELLR